VGVRREREVAGELGVEGEGADLVVHFVFGADGAPVEAGAVGAAMSSWAGVARATAWRKARRSGEGPDGFVGVFLDEFGEAFLDLGALGEAGGFVLSGAAGDVG